MPEKLARQDLGSGWQFKQTDDDENAWATVQSIPSVVHLDLLSYEK
jgi:hypothetical protein